MIQKLLKAQIGLFTFFIGAASGLIYGLVANTKMPRMVEVIEVKALKESTGRELNVRVTKVGRRRAVIRVTNISSDVVYLPYLGYGNGEIFYAVLGMEKRNPDTGLFERWEGGDFSPGLHALRPGDFYIDRIYQDSGTYRINFWPLLDSGLRDRIHRFSLKSTRGLFSKEEWEAKSNEIDNDIKLALAPPQTVEFEL